MKVNEHEDPQNDFKEDEEENEKKMHVRMSCVCVCVCVLYIYHILNFLKHLHPIESILRKVVNIRKCMFYTKVMTSLGALYHTLFS